VTRTRDFPLGAKVTLRQLDRDPHPTLAQLRQHEPASWVPVLGGWLVTSYELARAVMRDAERFTVDDPRFSTGQVIGSSMLSLDGPEHVRHRAPFTTPFRPRPVREALAADVEGEAERLITQLKPLRVAELRRGFAGPLAVATLTRTLGLERDETATLLSWYDAIVAAVNAITAGQPLPAAGKKAFAQLKARLLKAIADGALLAEVAAEETLSHDQIVSNAAVLLFGGIETTEGMITNALHRLLKAAPQDPPDLPAGIEESLRLEPAAAVIDRYATRATTLGAAAIAKGDLVRVSIAAANRDPQIFPDPDRFDPARPNLRRHLAFAHGPHVCLGIHLARLEARTALKLLFDRLPNLRLDPARPPAVRGLVFRKPQTLHAMWS
jgi:cytochrome P450